MNAIAVQIFDTLKMTIILDNGHGAIKSQVERWNSSQDTPECHLSFWKKKKHINILKQLRITGTIFHNQPRKQVVSYFGWRVCVLIEILSQLFHIYIWIHAPPVYKFSHCRKIKLKTSNSNQPYEKLHHLSFFFISDLHKRFKFGTIWRFMRKITKYHKCYIIIVESLEKDW